MTKQEFFELLDKFEKGHCTEAEKGLLFKFTERAQLKKFQDTWKLTEKEKAQIRLYDRISFTIENFPKENSPKPKYFRLWHAAVILLLLIGTTYTFFLINGKDKLEIPKDAITLELEDGTVKIIDEYGEANILDKSGNIVGQQAGNQLDYSSAVNNNEELVYNTLTIPYGKRFELLLSDGTRAHLNAGSSLKYPVKFLKGRKRQVYISGEAYLDVARDTLNPFIVEADGINVSVLGTQFNVYAYPEDTIAEIVLVEGSVGLYPISTEESTRDLTLLEPGQMGSFDRTSKRIQKKKVLTNIYTSWRNGELVFRNMTFANIAKKLERHYNVTIENTDDELAKTIFNASFGKEPLDLVLKSFSENYGIQYTFKEEKIIIN